MARGRAPPSCAAPGCPAPPAPSRHERRRDGGRGKTPRCRGAVRGGWTAQGFLVCRCARTRGPRLRLSPPRPRPACDRAPGRRESLASTCGGGGREEGAADFADAREWQRSGAAGSTLLKRGVFWRARARAKKPSGDVDRVRKAAVDASGRPSVSSAHAARAAVDPSGGAGSAAASHGMPRGVQRLRCHSATRRPCVIVVCLTVPLSFHTHFSVAAAGLLKGLDRKATGGGGGDLPALVLELGG